jgi:hypothetical protein
MALFSDTITHPVDVVAIWVATRGVQVSEVLGGDSCGGEEVSGATAGARRRDGQDPEYEQPEAGSDSLGTRSAAGEVRVHDLAYTLARASLCNLSARRSKIKALSDEQGTTLNVHRWRNLESSDPQRFEMNRQVHSLHKRIIQRNQQIVEKGEAHGQRLHDHSSSSVPQGMFPSTELLIQEKEKIYVELKNILDRQPGPQVAEQVSSHSFGSFLPD